MKIALITASPKRSGSASATLLDQLRSRLPAGIETIDVAMHTPALTDEAVSALEGCSAWVFDFPLYVDAIPSHLLSCLMQLESSHLAHRDVKIYGVVNCGFYEGKQTEPALMILRNWCRKAGFTWGGGIGIGCGAAMAMLMSLKTGSPLRAPVDKGIDTIASLIESPRPFADIFCNFGFPRAAYQAIAYAYWRKRIRENGGNIRDLNNRP